MVQEQLNKYMWVVDTLTRFKRMTRAELDHQWRRSSFSQKGEGLPRRTFYNFRQAIPEVFGLEIKYDASTREYYIDDEMAATGHGSASIADWLLNTAATNFVVSGSKEIASRIILEDIPSARNHLGAVMEAVKGCNLLQFDYAPYTRVNPSRNVVIEPYFLNLFKQRWYVTGRNTTDNKIKTYALDRMVKASVSTRKFTFPQGFDIDEYTRNSFGVIFTQGPVHTVVLRADSRQSKYLRTLPLHHTQREELHDSYSLFYYTLRLTPDLVSEILSMGSAVSVVSPPELRAMIKTELEKSLKNY